MASINSIVLRVVEPKDDPRWDDAPEAIKAKFYGHMADYAMSLKLNELRRGKDVHGDPLHPVQPRSRRDGATGPPLSPHQAESRTQEWLKSAVSRRKGTVTLYWPASWGKILGYHARELRIERDVIGLTPSDETRFRSEAKAYWKRIRQRPFPRHEPQEAARAIFKPTGPFTPEVAVQASPATTGPILAREKQFEGMNRIGRSLSESEQARTATPVPPATGKIPKWVAAAVRWAEKSGAKVEVVGKEAFGDRTDSPASYNWRMDRIRINKDHPKWLDPEKAARIAKERGWLSTDHPAHYVSHELGHKAQRDALKFGTLDREEQGKVFKKYLEPPRAELVPRIERLVSKYAAVNQHEFVAEMFAMLRVNQPVDSTLFSYYRSLGGVVPDAYRPVMPRLQTSG